MINDNSEFNDSRKIPFSDLAAGNWVCVPCGSVRIDSFNEKDHQGIGHFAHRLNDSEMLAFLRMEDEKRSEKKMNSNGKEIEQEIFRVLAFVNQKDDHGVFVFSNSKRCAEWLKFLIKKIVKIENTQEYFAITINREGEIEQINLSSRQGVLWARKCFLEIEEEDGIQHDIFFKNIFASIIATSLISHEVVHIRYAFVNGIYFYNLDGKRVVKITPYSITIEKITLDMPVFRSSVFPQLEPNIKNSDQKDFFNYINSFSLNTDDSALLKIAIICFFFPHIVTHGLSWEGDASGGKSTSISKVNMLVDPNSRELKNNRYTLTDDLESLQLTLAKNQMVAYDNLSFINQSQADILSCSITGASNIRRARFTDSDLFEMSMSTKLVLSGVMPNFNSYSDFSDRLIRFIRSPTDQYISSSNIEDEILKQIPNILGFIFSIIQKTIFEPLKKSGKTRFPDFENIGDRVGKLVGVENFPELLLKKLSQSAAIDVEASPISQFLIKKLGQASSFSEEVTKLYSEYEQLQHSQGKDPLVRTAAGFSKKIREGSTPLRKMGIIVTVERSWDRDDFEKRGKSILKIERSVEPTQQKLNFETEQKPEPDQKPEAKQEIQEPEQKLEEKPDITQTHFVCFTHRAGPWKTTDKTRSGSILAFHQKCELKFINESELDGIWEREK